MAAKGFKIAEGYLEVDADVDKALRKNLVLIREADGTIKIVEGAYKAGGKASGKAFSEELADAVETGAVKASTRAQRGLRNDGGRYRKTGQDIGDEVSKGIGDGLDRNKGGLLSRLFGMFSGGGKGGGGGGGSKGGGLFSGFGDAFGGAFEKVKELGATFQKLSSVAGVIGNIIMALGIAVSLPLIVALVGTLIQLSAALFALPAAAGVAVAALLPLILAFQGFGEAIGAAMSGDMNAFNESLKKLAPSARSVAREFLTLVPLLKGIQQTAQQGFFNALVGQVAKLQPLLAMTRWGVGQVANKLGELVAWVLAVAGSQKGIETFSQVFATTARILDRLGPAVGILFSGILSVIQVGLPWVEKFFNKLAEGAEFLGGWLEQISSDGTLEGWLSKAWEVGSDLFDLLKEVGGIVGALFGSGAAGDAGQGFIKDLTEAAKAYKEFLQSEDGQEAIKRAMEAVKALGAAIVWFAGIVDNVQGFINGFFAVLRAVGGWFADAWGWLKSAGSAIAGWFASAWAAVVGFFDTAGSKVSGWVDSVIGWFAALPGRIGAWLSALPGHIMSFFVAAFDAVTYYIGFAIGSVLKFFIDLPGNIASAWSSLVGLVTSFFRNAWEGGKAAVAAGILAVMAWFRELPGRISSAWSGLTSMVGGFFRNAWRGALDATSAGIQAVMGWFRDLPGRITGVFSGAGRWLYNAGRDILRGVADGMLSAVGWVVDAAKRAARNIIDGFLDAMEIGSPSKAMAREVGRWIPPGIQVGMEQAMPTLNRYIGGASREMTGAVHVAAPQVTTGPTYVAVDLGDGVRQVIRAEIRRAPAVVASAAKVGDRIRGGWLNTARA